MTGKHIELFLVEGVPGGLTTAEIAGWTGHVLSGPRSDLADVLGRPEAQRNGAYLLLGDDDEAIEGLNCYIGRTENFVRRFDDHQRKKEFWDRVVLITSKDDAFNEGHWGYLEARLVDLAKQAARCTLRNDNTPQGRRLSEAQASDMEAFLAQLQIVLPVLSVNVIRMRNARTPTAPASDSPTFHLTSAKLGINARAHVNGDEFHDVRWLDHRRGLDDRRQGREHPALVRGLSRAAREVGGRRVHRRRGQAWPPYPRHPVHLPLERGRRGDGTLLQRTDLMAVGRRRLRGLGEPGTRRVEVVPSALRPANG